MTLVWLNRSIGLRQGHGYDPSTDGLVVSLVVTGGKPWASGDGERPRANAVETAGSRPLKAQACGRLCPVEMLRPGPRVNDWRNPSRPWLETVLEPLVCERWGSGLLPVPPYPSFESGSHRPN